ncbi:MAG: TonB-dependent receptor [Bacteroidia bacterium]
MEVFRELTTQEKALKVNLNSEWYGSFAEIGAGQEVAAHFFKAGGASGTIAKTMSAYDMQFSDAIYGKTKRYVARSRLMTMLNHEYTLLEERLEERADNTCFFVLGNTIETLNYRKTNKGHGWMGIRFQSQAHEKPNDIILHMVLKDPEARWQQEAIGILGVNLVYSAFHHADDIDKFLKVLMEGLDHDRMEVDMLSFGGPSFDGKLDNRLVALKLVKNGISDAAMFSPSGDVLQASEALYKKNILCLRGRFRPVTHINLDMLQAGREQFLQEGDVEDERVTVLTELTLSNLLDPEQGTIDDKDFLDRVDILASLGQTVMVSNFKEYYRLISYLTQFTRKRKIGIILGVFNLESIFDERYYANLNGGILEAFGILFGQNVKLYVYPYFLEEEKILYTCKNFKLPPEKYNLFRYLFDNNKIEDLNEIRTDLMHITSDQVLSMIRKGESGWEPMVPESVELAVKKLGLFGYRQEVKSRPN